MKLCDLKDKKIAIWGLGIEGKAVLEKLNFLFPEKEITILNDENAIKNLKKMDVVIRFPGVSIYKKEIIEAKKKGVLFITEKSLFFGELKNKKIKTIAITGTKGKTTTSVFCAYLLEKIGYKVLLVGNMGIPSINFIDEIDKYDFVIIELSSYQTSDLIDFPTFGILLNLFPEHINWHLTHENYYKDKSFLLSGVKYKIVNAGNEKCLEYTKKYNDIIFFNTKNGIYYDNGFFFDKDKKIFSSKNMKLLGNHNYTNICSILTIFKILNINFSKIKTEYFNNFNPLEHRLQIIKHKNNFFINDSISTIPEATIACYETFKKKNIYGILGGFDRKQTYNELIRYILNNTNIKYLSLLGQTAERIKDELIKNNFLNFKKCESLEQCVEYLMEQSKNDKNSIIILSPASPSYDMFKNFEDRGNKFINLIKRNYKGK